MIVHSHSVNSSFVRFSSPSCCRDAVVPYPGSVKTFRFCSLGQTTQLSNQQKSTKDPNCISTSRDKGKKQPLQRHSHTKCHASSSHSVARKLSLDRPSRVSKQKECTCFHIVACQICRCFRYPDLRRQHDLLMMRVCSQNLRVSMCRIRPAPRRAPAIASGLVKSIRERTRPRSREKFRTLMMAHPA